MHRAHAIKPATFDHQPASIIHSPMLNKAAGTTAKSVPMSAASAGTVTVDGYIYLGDTNTPATSVSVSFCEADRNDTLGGQCYSGLTNSNGEIVIDYERTNTLVSLPSNVDYTMQVLNFAHPHFQISFYAPPASGVVCVQAVDDGCSFSTTTSPVTGVVAVLPAASTVSGTVTADGGAPVAGVTVYLDQNVSGSYTEYEQVSTASDGSFTFGGIADGAYEIEYVDNTGTYAYQAYSDESAFYEPDLITFAAGDNLTGADAQLHLAGKIAGTISSPGANSTEVNLGALSAEIQIFDGVTESWVNTGFYTPTAANGTYSLDGLAPDTYRVRVDYDGAVTRATFVGPPVVVTAGLTTTYNPTINVTGPNSTDSSIDSISASVAGISIAGWAVYPANDATPVGIALNVGSSWYGSTANLNNPESKTEEAVRNGPVSPFHGFASTTVIAPGTYNACIWVTEPTGPAVNIGCKVVTVPAPRKAVAHLDSVGTLGNTSSPVIQVKGYAVWPDSPASTVPLAVQVNGSWYAFSAQDTNPEGEIAVPGAGNSHGFDDSLSMGYKLGATYQVCVWVTEQAGGATNIGCQSLTIPVPGATIAKFDSATGSAAGVTVAGYALFPDNDAASVGVAVNIGSSWYGLTANQPSSEATTDVPTAGPNHGYSGTIPLPPGTYNACIWVSEPSGSAVNTGCHSVVVPAPARAVVHSDSVTGGLGTLTVSGWDVFPDSLSTHVGMALQIGASWYGVTANATNAEVPIAYPSAGADHGYTSTLALAAATYNVCVWTTEPSGPAVNTGCQSVVVTAPQSAVVHSDAVTGALGSLTVTGWDVFPDSLSTHVGMALQIGASWYGLTANVTNSEVPIAYPAATADHGYTDTLALAPGTYNVCIWTTEPSGPAVNTGCHSVVVTAARPAVTNIDSVTGGVGSVTVAGWDVFPDSLSTQVGMALQIGAAWYSMTANTPNAGSATAYPASVVDHGFTKTLALAPGSYNVCVWTVEPSGPAANIGCRTATVTAAPPAVTSYDTATAVTGGIQVTGYSQFPGTPATQVGVAAQIGNSWFGFTANGAATNSTYTGHGFTGFIPESHGTYNVCMWTSEPAGAASMQFGCKTVVVP